MKSYLLKFSILSCVVLLFASCNLLSSAGLSSQGLPTPDAQDKLTSTTANSGENIDHSTWDALLKKHVNAQGMVDYKGFKNDREELNKYLNMLSSKEPGKEWSVQELLAYYINLYNAETVDLILNNYPIKSIKDIDGAWTKNRVKIGDTEISLGGLENSVLRKMNEPRIHFAINCASISCPKLMREAYTAAKIDGQLDKAAKEFINSNKNEIDANPPKVSSIFDFYPKDFKEYGTVAQYINHYSNGAKLDPNAELQYKNYDWGLNEQK